LIPTGAEKMPIPRFDPDRMASKLKALASYKAPFLRGENGAGEKSDIGRVTTDNIPKTRRRMARERRGAESSVSMETLYYKTAY